MSKMTALFSLLFILVLNVSKSHAWLIFHKPEYKGKIIDIDTKEPIEEAVVVAIYRKYPIISGPAGGSAKVINVQEALTDKNGAFEIPSYTTLIAPLSREDNTLFIIFKPGYANIGELAMDSYFTGKENRDQEGSLFWNKELKFRLLANGSIELPKLKTREERLKALPSHLTEENKTPILNRLLDQEDHNLGLK